MAGRLALIDALKAIASQLVLLHHLSVYGPLARAAEEAAPLLVGWLFDYGRMVVQVFLVVAGYLAVRSLAPTGRALAAAPWALIGQRYQRLVLPFMAAMALAIVGNALAGRWLDDPMIGAPPDLWQIAAHALLMHGVLGIESLSAGAWYVAIDFQLFALTVLLLWLARWLGDARWLILGLTALSLFLFNRDEALDDWGVYFYGAYGLGAAAWWIGQSSAAGRGLLALTVLGGLALLVDFRPRLALALATALTLAIATRGGWLASWPPGQAFAFFGRISYALFLVHFPVLLLGNAVFARLADSSPAAILLGFLAIWAVTVGLATVFHHAVELPLGRAISVWRGKRGVGVHR